MLFLALCWLELDWVKLAHVAAAGADLEEDGEQRSITSQKIVHKKKKSVSLTKTAPASLFLYSEDDQANSLVCSH